MANIFGKKHAIDNRRTALETTKGALRSPETTSGPQTAKLGPFSFYPRFVNVICCLFASLRKAKSLSRTTKFCDKLRSEAALQTHVKHLWVPSPKIERGKTTYFGTVFSSAKLCQMPKNRTGCFLLFLCKHSLCLR